MLFTIESKFNLKHSGDRRGVVRRQKERYTQCFVVEVNRFGGVEVMVWVGVSRDFKTDLHIVHWRLNALNNYYHDYILWVVTVPYMRSNGLVLLQQDTASPPTVRTTMDFLHQQGVDVLPCSSLYMFDAKALLVSN